ncbi:MAG: SH3 domain-containing protein [Chloroflexi bacterium]|nr:SH3 domain-containing protein [Chloroflexota bacterium]
MLQGLVCRRRLVLLVMLACLFLAAPAAFAADITLSDTCSLANAIRSANGDTQVAPADQCAAGETTETDTIIFVADVEITAALPAITSDVRIVGNYTLSSPDTEGNTDTEYNFNLLTINSGAVRIEDLNLIGVDDSALKIEKTTSSDLEVLFNLGSIAHNNAATHGGAIYIAGGAEVTIHSSRIGHNDAPNGNGGAIYVDDSTLTLKWSNLHDNSASGNGGAIYFFNDSGDEHSLTIIGGRITRNSATDDDDSTNTAENGGAIYYENGTSTDGATSSLKDNSVHANRARNGGAIYVADGKLNIDNSTIDENSASAEGGGIYSAGGNLTVRHATIVKNQAATGSGIGVFTDDDENTTDPVVNVYNSIIAENNDTDAENAVCLTDLLSGNQGNVLRDVGCTEAQAAPAPLGIELVPHSGPNLPRAVLSRFYRLLEGSPAIDNGVDTEGQMLANDQTGHARPEGEGYDSGAFEYDVEEVWVLPPVTETRRPRSSSSDSAPSPANNIAHTCVAVHERDNGIEIYAAFGLFSGVQCQEINASGIGIQSVLDAGFVKAVDVWGYVEQGVQVCFDAAGPMVFLDAATAPRTVQAIETFRVGAQTCTSIWRPGSVILLVSQTSAYSWPAATAQPLLLPSPTPAPQCLGASTAAVNLRDAPMGSRIGGIYPSETVNVLASEAGWYQVEYLGLVGWVSAQYLSLNGECYLESA